MSIAQIVRNTISKAGDSGSEIKVDLKHMCEQGQHLSYDSVEPLDTTRQMYPDLIGVLSDLPDQMKNRVKHSYAIGNQLKGVFEGHSAVAFYEEMRTLNPGTGACIGCMGDKFYIVGVSVLDANQTVHSAVIVVDADIEPRKDLSAVKKTPDYLQRVTPATDKPNVGWLNTLKLRAGMLVGLNRTYDSI